ncbi:MAG: hypothetical protein M3N33_10365 [Actinomycetota bacterium]|nr:hypothetical protein [Actinomycetota bacterium]
MRDPWARRAAETFAVLAMGDAIVELVSPKEHSLLWEVGPAWSRRIARFFAENPNLMRLLGAAQLAFGLWLALRQYRED